MSPSDPVASAIALALYLAGLVLAFGIRAWQHRRRTGDLGIRRVGAGEAGAGRWGEPLFAAAVVLGAVGPLLAILAPATTAGGSGVLWWVGCLLGVSGLALVVASQQAMGDSWRVGVDPEERTELVTGGPFAVVRNPIFSAMGLAMLGVALMTPNPVSAAAVVALVAGVQLQVRFVEEPYLVRTHGAAYLGYAARAGRFVPGLGRLAHRHGSEGGSRPAPR